MNRNTELHFGAIPRIHQRRSKIDLSHTIKTTFSNGSLIPLDVQEVLPGDTIQVDMSNLIRMQTPIYPVMDNMFCDIYWFFVPRRLTWEHWEEFWGQNDDEWTQTHEYAVPKVSAPAGGWASGTIADYMGVPTKVPNIKIDAQYFRSYAKIFSDWFRSENVQKSAHFYTDETTRTGSNGTNYVTDLELGGMPAKANKLADYFTQALPSPQKGPAVAIPLGTTANITGNITNAATTTVTTNLSNVGDGRIPIVTRDSAHVKYTGIPMLWNECGEERILSGQKQMYLSGDVTGILEQHGSPTTFTGNTGNGLEPRNLFTDQPASYLNATSTAETSVTSTPNLVADLSDATAATINELRTAFAIQKYYEAQALYGSRYIEYLRGVFGVESSDARLQRSEYLGGMRFMINMNQIVQTSSTDETSPQGNTAGMSCTNVRDNCFTKSFEEHGILMCMLVTRTEHSYQQGINKMFSRTKWTDFYNPYFANLGNMPILNKEIYAQGESNDKKNPETGEYWDNEVFGYQEAWAEYRYIPNRVSGNMRSNATAGSLDAWTYVDNYDSMPYLSEEWLAEGVENVDNTIAVQSELADQMFGDFYIREYATRVMPVYSLPGLIDHA